MMARQLPSIRAVSMRDHSAKERSATPLELFFDLCFVVAVALLASDLHHGIADGHAAEAALTYAFLFVPVWWAWMSFTWFATAFDTDDAIHRVLTLLQMAGVLAVAATVHTAAEGDLVPLALAYTGMRVPLILQWLRAASSDRAHRAFALTYAAGLALAQSLWVLGAIVPGALTLLVFVVALAVDLSTPILAVRRSPGPVFHAGHIAERYGLFALIVLGETVLSVTIGLQGAVEGDAPFDTVVLIVAAALAIAFGLWWIYFDALGRDGLTRNRRAAFVWGYGHYLLYAALAAVGAGVQAQLDLAAGEGSHTDAVVAVSLPVALVLATVGGLQVAANRRPRDAASLFVGAALVALTIPAAPWLTAATANVTVAVIVVAVTVVGGLRRAEVPR